MSEISNPPAPAQMPVAPTPQGGTGNGFGIASLVLGIVTMAGFAIPFLNFATIATGVVGAILGITGLIIKFKPRKAAMAGVILSGLGLILSIVLVVVFTAAFAGATKAISGDTVPKAGPSSSASVDGQSSSSASFKDGILTTADMKIEITDHKIIPVGQPGNEYGTTPVIAFYYKTTNLTNKKLNPSTSWLFAMKAIQDNNPNAVNELNVGLLPDDRFRDTQLEDIKQGGIVENAVAYNLSDETTPVKLVASDLLGAIKIGTMTYNLK